jgi:hypothetical protein
MGAKSGADPVVSAPLLSEVEVYVEPHAHPEVYIPEYSNFFVSHNELRAD